MTLKRCGQEKRGRETKNLKRGGQAGSRGWYLKKWDWNPLMNYDVVTRMEE